MIDWEELLEDVNWKRAIIIVVVGVIVIAGAIFVLSDRHKYSQLKASLQSDLKELKDFEKFNKSPAPAELEAIKKETETLTKQLEATKIKLPPAIDKDEIDQKLHTASVANKINIDQLRWGNNVSEGYCVISPLELVLTGAARSSAAFLSDLYTWGYPVADKSPTQGLEGTKTIRLEFYAFDDKDWSAANDCKVKVNPPAIVDRDIMQSRLFGSGLTELKHEVDVKQATIKDVGKKLREACEVKAAHDRVKDELEVIKDKFPSK
jgi:Tfp pilus assembly protein PilO